MKQKVAIIDGIRTPFVKAWGEFQNLTALDLAKQAAKELINKTEINPNEINEVIMGTVFHHVYYPNIARELAIALGMKKVPGLTLTRACASSAQTVTTGVESILAGKNDVILTGGCESLSQLQVAYSQDLINNLQKLGKARTIPKKLSAISELNLKDLIPSMPDITELSTGLSMGQHAEIMARKNGITREDQDRYAFESHLKSSKAVDEGKFNDEIVTTFTLPEYAPIKIDNMVRKETSLEKLAKLKPVFDKKYGTITAGNASPLTDGASAVLIMSDKKAKELGYKPKAYIKDYAFAAIDPSDQLLLGNAYSIPKVLEQAKLTLKDIDLIDMHEAFASQVLSTLKALSSKEFAKKELGKNKAVGDIDPNIFNINGGSIALGHPFGATGGRMITTMANQLQRKNKKYGLIAICAAGGMSLSMIIEKA